MTKILTLTDAHQGTEVDMFVDHIFYMEDRLIDNPKYDPTAAEKVKTSRKTKKKLPPVEPQHIKTTVIYSHHIANSGNSVYVKESRAKIKEMINNLDNY